MEFLLLLFLKLEKLIIHIYLLQEEALSKKRENNYTYTIKKERRNKNAKKFKKLKTHNWKKAKNINISINTHLSNIYLY